ncbi:hypothetical protein CDAR_90831, partial [Caerostris darwini]
MYDPTNESYNTSMNMESRQSAMQDFEMSRYQEMEFVAMSIARNLDITEKNASCASDLNSASLNVSYNVNPHTENEYNHRPALQPVSIRTNAVMRDKFHDEFLNIQNSAYPNFENMPSYSIPDFGQGVLDSQQGMNEIPHCSNKSQAQFDDKMKFQNVFLYHYCGKCSSCQKNLNGQQLPVNSYNVPFKFNDCNKRYEVKGKFRPCPKMTEVCDETYAIKLQKIIKPGGKRFSCNVG